MSPRWLHPVLSLLVLAGCADGARREPRTIQIVGRGSVSAAPKAFVVSASVRVDHQEAEKAVAGMHAIAARLIAAARPFVADDGELATEGLRLSAEYDYQSRQFRYFSASQWFRVRVRDHRRAGELLAELVRAGANGVDTEFEVDDRRAMFREARLAAVRDARANAERLAAEYGDRVGRALRIGNPGDEDSSAMLFEEATPRTGAGLTDTTEIALKAPDRVEVEATLPVVFELLP